MWRIRISSVFTILPAGFLLNPRGPRGLYGAYRGICGILGYVALKVVLGSILTLCIWTLTGVSNAASTLVACVRV